MEALQLAQMLADLNDLQAAQDQRAAKSLVTANKNLDREAKDGSASSSLVVEADSKLASRVASPAGKFDKLGRRIFTPPLSRGNSYTTPVTSIPGTPRNQEGHADSDIDRASTLLSLYEIRAKLREQDNSSLQKAREKINALAAKQAQRAQEQQQHQHMTSAALQHKTSK
ncbi:hypothetical protein BX600DRAFT_507853 [Xylariales sp. PMI_506]|nr:hypothetical protein BX600DRAFT_507853 [Xylariales sp. PMI_506]